MSQFLAQHLLVKINEGNGTYRALAGLHTRRFDLAASPTDSVQFTAHRWRKLQPASGELSMRVAGDGLFADAAAHRLLHTLFVEGGAAALRIIVPDFGVFSGDFLITELAYTGRQDALVSWHLAVQSNGEIGFEVA